MVIKVLDIAKKLKKKLYFECIENFVRTMYVNKTMGIVQMELISRGLGQNNYAFKRVNLLNIKKKIYIRKICYSNLTTQNCSDL